MRRQTWCVNEGKGEGKEEDKGKGEGEDKEEDEDQEEVAIHLQIFLRGKRMMSPKSRSRFSQTGNQAFTYLQIFSQNVNLIFSYCSLL